MLNEATKQEIRDRLSMLSKAMPGFRPRAAQRTMIAEVAKAFAAGQGENAGTKSKVVIQAGTGTGKSLAYVLPGAILSLHTSNRLVISTSTVALQEQLVKKDIPLFLNATGLGHASVSIAKGRGRYICLRKLAIAAQAEKGTSGVALGKDLSEKFNSGRWNGDRDELSDVTEEMWKPFGSEHVSCMKAKCPYKDRCVHLQARRKIQSANIIVSNHDLVLADISSESKILPAIENSLYVFDEADTLHDKAIEAFASSFTIGACIRVFKRLSGLEKHLPRKLGSKSFLSRLNEISRIASDLTSQLWEIEVFCHASNQLKPSPKRQHPTLVFADSCLPEGFFEIAEKMEASSRNLSTEISSAVNELNSIGAADDPEIEKIRIDLTWALERANTVFATSRWLLTDPSEKQPPVAKWIEYVDIQGAQNGDYKLSASPVIAADSLSDMLWSKAAGVVATSATITSLGLFDDFLNRTGIGRFAPQCLDLASPFDYQNQGLIEIPPSPIPKEIEGHTMAIAGRVIGEIEKNEKHGALALFSSRRQMLDVYAQIPEELRSTIILQGATSKSAIIAEHKRKINAGEQSFIFGLDSFSTGVDLPGAYCRLVIIAKIPFAAPDTPILKTLSDWLTKNNRDPFMEISVPDAARKLEQSIGRLIRTESDFGRVVVFDPRLYSTRYGRLIINGLPPFRIFMQGKEYVR